MPGEKSEIKVEIIPDKAGAFDKTLRVFCNTADGSTSLKKWQQPDAAAPEPGKKDRSFLAVAGGAIVLMAILYFIKLL